MNEFQKNIADTAGRTLAENHIEDIRQRGGIFVEAVRVTRMPMIVTDAALPGNPILFANPAFTDLSGYTLTELLGQDPHFMNGEGTDPRAIARYEAAIREGRDDTVELRQYRKDGTPFIAILFASPLTDGQGRVTHHFLSYLDISRRHTAEVELQALTRDLERRVAARTAELEAANGRLRQLVTERETLLVEVNHRAKNSLAVAASLLGIQGGRQADPAVRGLFEEAQGRLAAMARVHDLLSKSESSQRVDLATYLSDLCEALRPGAETADGVGLTASAESILVPADTAFSLGIVLTELITNALKYAFPPPLSGTVEALLHHRPAGRIELVVRDDGVGMPQVRQGSLGYSLIRSLVEQIDGEIDLRNEGGLTVTISFPDPAWGQGRMVAGQS
jgi:PAS domain S-box-containing protein